MFLCVFLRFHFIRLLKLYACKGFALFSILLFYSTVFFHFTEQINDDDDDDDDMRENNKYSNDQWNEDWSYYLVFCTIFYILFFLPFTVNKVMYMWNLEG